MASEFFSKSVKTKCWLSGQTLHRRITPLARCHRTSGLLPTFDGGMSSLFPKRSLSGSKMSHCLIFTEVELLRYGIKALGRDCRSTGERTFVHPKADIKSSAASHRILPTFLLDPATHATAQFLSTSRAVFFVVFAPLNPQMCTQLCNEWLNPAITSSSMRLLSLSSR